MMVTGTAGLSVPELVSRTVYETRVIEIEHDGIAVIQPMYDRVIESHLEIVPAPDVTASKPVGAIPVPLRWRDSMHIILAECCGNEQPTLPA